ncbi:MAG: hypothetical protein ACRDRL_31685 [Sciscionella sp.]
MSLILTLVLFTAIVAAAVVFTVRTALRARIREDGEIPDPLDEYIDGARRSVRDAREVWTRFSRTEARGPERVGAGER